MGLNSSLSSPYLRSGLFKKGGEKDKVDSDGSNRVNRMMIFDHSLRGFKLQGLPRL